MDEKKKPDTKEVGAPKKLEKSSSSKKLHTPSKKNKADAEKAAEFDIFVNELEDHLDNLLVEDVADFDAQSKEKIKHTIIAAETIESKRSVDFDDKPPETHPHIIDKDTIKDKAERGYVYDGADEDDAVAFKNVYKSLEKDIKENIDLVKTIKSNQINIIEDFEGVDSEKRKRKTYRNIFVFGGILIILSVVISLIIFKPVTWLNRNKDAITVIAHKTNKTPIKIQSKKIMPPSNNIINQETEPVAQSNTVPSQKILEAKKTAPQIGKETKVSIAPALSYPYSIHADSFRSKQSAELSAEAYRKIGLQAFWVWVELGKKGVWYRVFIGCYKDSETAEKIISTKQLKGIKPGRTRYANFIGTYLSEDSLKNQMRFLSESGYSPYFIKDDKGEHHLYVGAFYTIKGAEKLSNELSSKGIRSQVVER